MKFSLNDNIVVMYTIMKLFVASAAEAKSAALFRNSKDTSNVQTGAWEIGHSQLPIPIRCDINTSPGIANDNIKIQISVNGNVFLLGHRSSQEGVLRCAMTLNTGISWKSFF